MPAKDQMLEVVRRAMEEFINKGNIKVLDEVCTDDYVWHPGDVAPTMDKEMHQIDHQQLRNAFPSLRMEVNDMVAEGDKVTTTFTMTSVHKGPLTDRTRGGVAIMGTGRRVTWSGVTVHRISDDGKIAEGWLNYDRAGFEQQLGLATRI
jgi:predicted ester cyclase